MSHVSICPFGRDHNVKSLVLSYASVLLREVDLHKTIDLHIFRQNVDYHLSFTSFLCSDMKNLICEASCRICLESFSTTATGMTVNRS